MRWDSCCHASGTWFWWSNYQRDWTAWVIDDSIKRGRRTEYRIAASLRTVTFFSQRKYASFHEAKLAAIDLMLQMQASPLTARSGHFSKKTI